MHPLHCPTIPSALPYHPIKFATSALPYHPIKIAPSALPLPLLSLSLGRLAIPPDYHRLPSTIQPRLITIFLAIFPPHLITVFLAIIPARFITFLLANHALFSSGHSRFIGMSSSCHLPITHLVYFPSFIFYFSQHFMCFIPVPLYSKASVLHSPTHPLRLPRHGKS